MTEDTFIDDVKKRDAQRQLYLAHIVHVAGFLDGIAYRVEKADILNRRQIASDLREYAEKLTRLPGVEIDR